MKNIIGFFIRYPIMVNLGIILIFIVGLFSFNQVQFTLDPEEQPKEVYVDVIHRGASPVEIEERIIARIEDNLRGITGIDRFTSVSRENNGRITVELFEGTDINEALSDVENAVNRVTNFPEGMESPIIHKQEMLSPAMTVAVKGEVPLQELKDYAKTVRDDWMFDGGLSKILIEGLPDEEIEISVRESDLERWEMTFAEVAGAVRHSNIDITGGELKTEGAKWQIRARNKRVTAAELQNIVVRADPEGSRILLKEIAEVKDRFEDQPVRRVVNGEEAVVIRILTTNSEDLLRAADFVKEYTREFNETHSGVELLIIEDFSAFIEERVASLWENGLLGLILVLVILTLFLDKRIAFWAALTIPMSFLGTFILAQLGYPLSINVISIFGFILVLGMLVDTGVVVAENIYRHYTEYGKNPIRAAMDGAAEVAMPMIISLLTTAAAFCLFFFLPGRPGTFFSEISIVVITSLLTALVVSFFIIPAMLSRSIVLTEENRQTRWEKRFNESLVFLRDRWFIPFWDIIIEHWKGVTIILFVLLLFASVFSFQTGWLPVTFFPNLDDDIQLVTLELEPGTPSDTIEQRLIQIEEAIQSVNIKLNTERMDGNTVVKHIERVIGPQSHQGRLRIVLMGGSDRGIPSYQMNRMFREASGEIHGAGLLRFTGATAEDRFGGMPVSISFNGNNLAMLRSAAQELRLELEPRNDLSDVADNDKRGLPEIHVSMTPSGEQLGLNLREVMGQVRAGFFGLQVQSLQRNDDEVRVWIRFSESEYSDYRNLEQMRIRTPAGAAYPLGEIATLIPYEDVLQINRQNGRRQILVDADVAHPSLSAPAILADIEANLLPGIMERHPGVSYEIEGQQREASRVVNMIRLAGPVILLIMFSLIVINFQSISQTLLVFLSLPFALVGAVFGHIVHGVPFSIFSVLGIIAMIGILINNMLVLITAFNDNLTAGMRFDDALKDAVQSRFRPILLTTLSTVAGLVPMIFIGGLVSAFLRPPALSIAYGLLFGLLITLVLMPVMIIVWNWIRVQVQQKLTGLDVERESVEPAVQLLDHQKSVDLH